MELQNPPPPPTVKSTEGYPHFCLSFFALAAFRGRVVGEGGGDRTLNKGQKDSFGALGGIFFKLGRYCRNAYLGLCNFHARLYKERCFS